MHRTILLLGTVALAACGQSSGSRSGNNADATNPAAEKPRPAYCFFKDSATKAWKASVDKSGNVVVSGKGYAEDSRYKAVLAPATVSGASGRRGFPPAPMAMRAISGRPAPSCAASRRASSWARTSFWTAAR